MTRLTVNDRLMTIATEEDEPIKHGAWRQLRCEQPVRSHHAAPLRTFEAWDKLPVALHCDGCGRMRRYAGSMPSTWIWRLLDRVLLADVGDCYQCRPALPPGFREH